MSFRQPHVRPGARLLGPSAALLLGLTGLWGGAVGPATPAAAQDDLALGQEVYQEANCVGCHKWHGGGGGGYGGAALSLRETMLDRAQLTEVVRCGRPATRMPYHDRHAYEQVDCYGGMTETDLGADLPPKAAAFLRDEEIEAVVAYVAARLQGHGEPTKQDCIAFWGQGSRECAAMP